MGLYARTAQPAFKWAIRACCTAAHPSRRCGTDFQSSIFDVWDGVRGAKMRPPSLERQRSRSSPPIPPMCWRSGPYLPEPARLLNHGFNVQIPPRLFRDQIPAEIVIACGEFREAGLSRVRVFVSPNRYRSPPVTPANMRENGRAALG
jgi:hypothetical protein